MCRCISTGIFVAMYMSVFALIFPGSEVSSVVYAGKGTWPLEKGLFLYFVREKTAFYLFFMSECAGTF